MFQETSESSFRKRLACMQSALDGRRSISAAAPPFCLLCSHRSSFADRASDCDPKQCNGQGRKRSRGTLPCAHRAPRRKWPSEWPQLAQLAACH